MGRFLRSGLGSEKGSSPVCLLGGRRVGMWTAARSGSGQRPRPAPRFTGTHPRTDDASSPAAGFSYLDAWWWGGFDVHPADLLQRDGTRIS